MSVYSGDFPIQLEGESNRNYNLFLQYNDCRDMRRLEVDLGRRQCFTIAKTYRWMERLSEWDKACNKAYVNRLAERIYRYNDKKMENYVDIYCSIQDMVGNFMTSHSMLYNGSGFDFIEKNKIVRNFINSIRAYLELSERITDVLENLGFDQIKKNNTKPQDDLEDFLEYCESELKDFSEEELVGYLDDEDSEEIEENVQDIKLDKIQRDWMKVEKMMEVSYEL